MTDLSYSEGEPSASGLYVCYVNPEGEIPWANKLLLMWHEGRWWYRESTQRYRETLRWPNSSNARKVHTRMLSMAKAIAQSVREQPA